VVAYLISLDRGLDRGAAEELAQDAFVVVLQRWDQVRDHQEPMGSVIASAHHVWQNHRRFRLRHPVDPLTDRDGWAQPVDGDLELAISLRQALARLTERQRQVILLRYLVDLTVQQTAEVLEIAAGTVTWTTKEAVAALARLLDPEGGGRDG
jgi:RNA polymerase sigma-70 factor (ECF subfamily)